MKSKEHTLMVHSPAEMDEFASWIAGIATRPLLIFLYGQMGAGKTTFVKGLANALGITQEITSPTFTLAVPYHGECMLLHVDAFRIKDPGEADELGIEEALDQGAVVTVEWPEKVESALPAPDITITIQTESESVRRVLVRSPIALQFLRV
jgi:tRNA threonylcarbamoyladenosine biosynthesis protein TsaE